MTKYLRVQVHTTQDTKAVDSRVHTAPVKIDSQALQRQGRFTHAPETLEWIYLHSNFHQRKMETLSQTHLSPYLAAMDDKECVPLRSPSRADRSPNLS